MAAIGEILLIVSSREETLEQINVRNVELQQPTPQCRVIHAVKLFCEVQVAAEEGLTPLCRVLDGPVQALQQQLCGMQPAKSLL